MVAYVPFSSISRQWNVARHGLDRGIATRPRAALRAPPIDA
jgi:hypothetical protein